MVDLKFLRESEELANDKVLGDVIECIDVTPYDEKEEYQFNHCFLCFPYASTDMPQFFDYSNKEEFLKYALEIYIPTNKEDFEEDGVFGDYPESDLEDILANLEKYEKQLEDFKNKIREVLK